MYKRRGESVIPEIIISSMSEPVKAIFNMMDADVLGRINEIRIKRGGYLTVVIKNTGYFTDCNGDLYSFPERRCVKISESDFDKLFMSLCDYSLHSHTETLINGYISSDGVRIGAVGEAVSENGIITGIKNISSLNIRIPRDVKGAADNIVKTLYKNGRPSLIIAGAPGSGKTTLIRDIARSLSLGKAGKCLKVCAVDERYELFSKFSSVIDYGNVDVLSGYPKAKGIETAVRTMSPDLIVCDEIGTLDEAKAISFAFSSGVMLLLSLHAGSVEELKRKSISSYLLNSGEFSHIALLRGFTYKADILNISEAENETCGSGNADNLNDCSGRTLLV